MNIGNYGVMLRRLSREKIELVRNWRNDPKISQYMEFQGYITAEMQARWFEKINNDNNYYFIIEFKDKEVGLVNVKDVDYNKKVGEGGIFIYDDSYLNTTLSFRVILCLNDFCFDTLKLEQTNAHIMRDNKRAIAFNKVFGYKLSIGQEDKTNQLYTLKKADYEKSKITLKKIMK